MGFITETHSAALVQAVQSLRLAIENLSLGGEISVTELKSMPPENNLIIGQDAMEFRWVDEDLIDYPAEVIANHLTTTTTNNFVWEQLYPNTNLFRVSGRLVATFNAVPKSSLDSYNSTNGTTISEKTKEILTLPILNNSGADIPLSFVSRRVTDNSGTISTWIKPKYAVWKRDSQDVLVEHDTTRYAIIFSSGSWDPIFSLDMSFWAIAPLNIA